jgi:hypothetical protein
MNEEDYIKNLIEIQMKKYRKNYVILSLSCHPIRPMIIIIKEIKNG